MEARVMEKLIDTGFEYLKDQVRWPTGMKEELQRLRDIHPKIHAVVAFASTQVQIRDQNPVLDEWLWQLRDAIDEADDVLDELEYMKHKKQLAKNKEKTKVRSIMKYIKERSVEVGTRALKIDPKIDPSLKRLDAVVKKLYTFSFRVDTFIHHVEDAKQKQQEQQKRLLGLYKGRETEPLFRKYPIGRDKEKDFILQWLLKEPSNEERQTDTGFENISLLSIVGPGGIGKTTLLQQVYEDERTKEFDLKMWVSVSCNFDVKQVMAEMLECLTMKKTNLDSLDALQMSLKSVLQSRKFLLVLDNIWGEEERDISKWEDVLAPLTFGSLGSKILVTTRMDSVASMLSKVINKEKETLGLESLKYDDCFLLLIKHAFADAENPEDHKILIFIAETIAGYLSGSPLAVKVIGGVLNSSLDERHWIEVLKEGILSSAEAGQNDIMSSLRLSYIFLPKHLKNCFTFCCIFPHNHEFDKDDLVRMWIALGFIQSSNIGETQEDVGGRYFDVLVKKSFFEKFQTRDRTYYSMHDLLYELAQSVSAQKCFKVVSDKMLSIPKTIQHLSVETSNLKMLREVMKLKNLHSLFLSYRNNFDSHFFGTSGSRSLFDELTETFKASRNIRLLYIYAPHLEKIPEEIGYLIHLRYLKIVKSSVTLLPRSLSNLYHLQFLMYDENVESLPDDFLPRDMNNLYNLHYLKLPWQKFPRMNGTGKLNSLQVFDEFYAKNETGNKTHCNIGWKTFNWQEGSNRCSISIQNCPNLISLRGFQEVETTENFQLIISELIINDTSMLLMEPFRRITSLEKLAIQDNDEQVSSFPMEAEEWFLHVSSSLCKLYFSRLKYLESLPSSLESLSSLKILHVQEVPQLRELPNIPASLEDVLLEGLESLEYLPDSLENISSLKYLKLKSIPCLQLLPDLPSSLNELYLEDLYNLHSLPPSLSSISSLQKLHITNVQLRELTDVPPFLCELKLGHLDYLNCLPSRLPMLSSLQKLRIDGVPQLRELPDLPPSLKHLSVKNCHSELMERYKMFSGSDWRKIARIPEVHVSTDGKI